MILLAAILLIFFYICLVGVLALLAVYGLFALAAFAVGLMILLGLLEGLKWLWRQV